MVGMILLLLFHTCRVFNLCRHIHLHIITDIYWYISVVPNFHVYHACFAGKTLVISLTFPSKGFNVYQVERGKVWLKQTIKTNFPVINLATNSRFIVAHAGSYVYVYLLGNIYIIIPSYIQLISSLSFSFQNCYFCFYAILGAFEASIPI